MVASQNGRDAVVRVLLESGASVNVVASDSWSALTIAAQCSHAAIVRALVEHGAAVDPDWGDRVNALYLAASE